MRPISALSLAIWLLVVCLSRAEEAKPAAESKPRAESDRSAARADLKALQGTWERVAMELEGKPAGYSHYGLVVDIRRRSPRAAE